MGRSVSFRLRNCNKIGEQALTRLLAARSWTDNGHVGERIRLEGDSVHYALHPRQRIAEGQRQWLDAYIKGTFAQVRSGLQRGDQLDAFSLSGSFVYLFF